ncbi:MAG: sigma-54 dependent transcriptional regulator [Bacteroidota bacterium]
MLLKNSKLLIIDDDVDVLTAMSMLFKSQAKEVVTEKNPNKLTSLLKAQKFDLVILDMNFNRMINTGNEGIYWLNTIKSLDKEVDVVLITAYGDMDLAIKSLKEGASDFFVKPWENEKLVESIKEILAKKKSDKKEKWKPEANKVQLLGESELMKDVFFKLRKIAPTDANILILGENGTGKDLIARALHDNSLRKDQPFVKVDVGALTTTLFESELFGHKKGAFTDARDDRQGRFEAANGGTLFLDEIGNISLQQQAKLLSVLQNREIIPLGSNRPIPIDIRLICATNVGLEYLAKEENFRKDLYYRINTVDMLIPALRDRGKDILLLARHFIEVYTDKYLKPSLNMEDSFVKKLKSYHFPGNVRELQYVLERAVIMVEGDSLTDSDLVFSPIESASTTTESNEVNLEAVERNTILKVIEKNKGNISKSAKELGITRTALYRRLNKHGL